eukprot:5041179-Pleurochrysis_carterae.AAC.4
MFTLPDSADPVSETPSWECIPSEPSSLAQGLVSLATNTKSVVCSADRKRIRSYDARPRRTGAATGGPAAGGTAAGTRSGSAVTAQPSSTTPSGPTVPTRSLTADERARFVVSPELITNVDRQFMEAVLNTMDNPAARISYRARCGMSSRQGRSNPSLRQGRNRSNPVKIVLAAAT